MIAHYHILAERLRAELPDLEKVIGRTEKALTRAVQQPDDQAYFMAAAALDLHGFSVGVERLFETIAREMDGGTPTGPRWHRDLPEQMALAINGVRPAVLLPETQTALLEYLEFRRVVRNVHTFNLRPKRVEELGNGLRSTFTLVQRDLLAFANFLDGLSKADEVEEEEPTGD